MSSIDSLRSDILPNPTAYLVGLQHPTQQEEEAQDLLLELEELVTTMGLPIAGSEIVRLREISAQYYIGTGKVAEIKRRAEELEAQVIVFDDELSPSQQRNLEQTIGLAVIDRREVILDIFGQRATTREAQLQIELAKAAYDLPRLVRAWTHLSRQRGAANMKGEGERQLELDRRLVKDRINRLNDELAVVRSQRATQRKLRQKRPTPNAAIVGYTNAGKSSLLNHLSDAGVLADDKLFATLDPITKRILLPNNQELLVTDTVGFIRKLPHDLVDAFKSTLEETVLADFLVMVVDAADHNAQIHIDTTQRVLDEIGADKKRTLIVFNKIDLPEAVTQLGRLRSTWPDASFISVRTGEGVPELLERMARFLEEDLHPITFAIPFDRYDIVALLRSRACIEQEDFEGLDAIRITASIPPDILGRVREFIHRP